MISLYFLQMKTTTEKISQAICNKIKLISCSIDVNSFDIWLLTLEIWPMIYYMTSHFTCYSDLWTLTSYFLTMTSRLSTLNFYIWPLTLPLFPTTYQFTTSHLESASLPLTFALWSMIYNMTYDLWPHMLRLNFDLSLLTYDFSTLNSDLWPITCRPIISPQNSHHWLLTFDLWPLTIWFMNLLKLICQKVKILSELEEFHYEFLILN